MNITLPQIPDAMVTVEDMLGNVLRLRYSDHDVHNATKLLDLAEETYLANTMEIGPLDKTIMDPTQWIMELYKSGIISLSDILHFMHGTNVMLYIKQLVTYVHGGILWMDMPIQLYVALISKIT
jgi:hypothetical protein